MNDYYYYTIVCRYIDKKDRAICSRRDRHLMVYKNPRYRLFNATIYLHLGSPCGRYCICRYFDDEDILGAYNDYRNNITNRRIT